MRNVLWVLLFTALTACRQNVPAADAALGYPENPLISGPVWPIRLAEGSGSVVISDWFGPDFKPDSVDFPEGLTGRISGDLLGLTPSRKLTPAAGIRFWSGGQAYTIPVFRSSKIPVELTLDASAGAEGPVQVAGEFNSWNPMACFMTREGDQFKTTLNLDPGRYAYQFVVKGKWSLDPANPDSMSNNNGGFNSVLSVKRPERLPFLRPLSFRNGEVRIQLEGESGGLLVLWEYAELDDRFVQREGNEIIVRLPAEAREKDRSHLFLVAWNEQGRSNDLRVPLLGGIPAGIDNTAMNTDWKREWQAMTLYFPLTDRFANGEPSNDRITEDPRILPPANFYGGDLQGLQQHLEYIQDLGINTLWISPVARNPEGAFQEYPEPRRWFSGYHGYWPVSYREVDPRFGGDAALESLVKAAHERGMRVLLDFVANHVHQEHPMIRQHPDWATDLVLEDGTRNLRRWDDHRLTTWFDDFLPSLDFENPVITEAVTDSALFWIERFDLDGFRHDATKHIPELFWRTLTAKLHERFPDKRLYQIGETFGSRDLIASYLGPATLDAQFDFPLYFSARSALTSESGDFQALAMELLASLDAFGHHHLMGNITGNHDMARFTSIAGGGLRPGEDDKEAGWNRLVEVGSPLGYRRMALLLHFQCAIPGLPVLYYGDEIGMPGGGDPDSRRMMRFSGWSSEEQRLHEECKSIYQRRLNDPALIFGSTEIVQAEKDLLVIRRDWFGKSTWVLLNKGSEPRSVSLGGQEPVALAPYSGVIR